MKSKGIFEGKSRGREEEPKAEGSRWLEQLQRMAQSLKDHFTTLMKRFKSKRRAEAKSTGLGDEEVSENELLLEDVIARFEESKCRAKADTQKETLILKTKKRNLKKWEKSNGKIWRDKKTYRARWKWHELKTK